MRLLVFVTAVALAGAACSNAVTDPFYSTSGPVPAGLPASFQTLSRTDSLLGSRSLITAAGDSVAVVATGAGDNCSIQTANAGIFDGTLVVTRLDSIPPGGLNCLANALGPTPFKIVVHAVPSGRYTVVLRERFQVQAGGSEFRERELTRGSVAVH